MSSFTSLLNSQGYATASFRGKIDVDGRTVFAQYGTIWNEMFSVCWEAAESQFNLPHGTKYKK